VIFSGSDSVLSISSRESLRSADLSLTRFSLRFGSPERVCDFLVFRLLVLEIPSVSSSVSVVSLSPLVSLHVAPVRSPFSFWIGSLVVLVISRVTCL
jgi:hypothetical protein